MAARYGRESSGMGPWLWGGCGCCGGCIAIPVLIVVIFGAGFFAVLRGTDVVDDALQIVRSHPEVVEALGEPIEKGWQVQGSFNVSDEHGEADLSIPIHGPAGSGVMRFEAWKKSEGWTFDRFEVELDDSGRIIDLLGEPLLEPLLEPEMEAEASI